MGYRQQGGRVGRPAVAGLVTGLVTGLVAGLVAGPAVAAAGAQREPARNLFGHKAPPWGVSTWFQLPEGKSTLDVGDFAGKVVLVSGFQSWCPGCHELGFPALKALTERYAGSEGMRFVAIQTVFEGYGFNTAEAGRKDVADTHGLAIPFGHDAGTEQQPGSSFMRAYRSMGTPWTVVIDRDGIVRYSSFAGDEGLVAQVLDPLLVQAQQPAVGTRLALETLEWEGAAPEQRIVLLHFPGPRGDVEAARRGMVEVLARHRAGTVEGWVIGHGAGPQDPNGRLAATLRERAGFEGGVEFSVLCDPWGVIQWIHRGAPEPLPREPDAEEDGKQAIESPPPAHQILLDRYLRELIRHRPRTR